MRKSAVYSAAGPGGRRRRPVRPWGPTSRRKRAVVMRPCGEDLRVLRGPWGSRGAGLAVASELLACNQVHPKLRGAHARDDNRPRLQAKIRAR